MSLLISVGLYGQSPAQRQLRDIPDPDPSAELQQFQIADGFEVNLFAANPMLAKPIQMNFDSQGRLWVASSSVYPQIEPGQVADDKVLIIEDTNGTGVADKTTVFADGLLIPTGVLPGDNGCYVANSTELLHLADQDGDGRADRRRVVLSGFGTEDTHHILHTLRWGPDGALYMNQSIYIHSHIETPYGVKRMNGGGIWRFQPASMKLDVFTLGLVNPWGHAWDRFGTSFETDGAGGEGINYVFPGFVGMTSPGAQRILHGLNPGQPKLCGLEVLGGTHLPDDWRGDLIANDFRAHRVCRFRVRRNGMSFVSEELEELIKTPHVAFRPIDVKMGPDGAIYIADWYNPIIQHGEVDFRDPRRDHVHGRIWRIVATGRPLVPRVDLSRMPAAELVRLISSPEPWQREQARLLLKDRPRDTVLSAIGEQVESLDVSSEKGQLRGLDLLWAYQAIDHCPESLVKTLIGVTNPRVRAAATRVFYYWNDRLPQSLDWLATQVVDPDPQVRLEAIRALGRRSEPVACEIAMRALSQPVDQFIDFSLWTTARETQSSWLPALRQGTLDFDGQSGHLAFALKAVESGEVAPMLEELLNVKPLEANLRRTALEVLADVGDAAQMQRVWNSIAESSRSDDEQVALLRRLVNASRQRRVIPSGPFDTLLELAKPTHRIEMRRAAIQAIGLWQPPNSFVELKRVAESDDGMIDEAIDALAELGSDPSQVLLQQIAESSRSASVKLHAAAALVRCNQAVGTQLLATVMSDLPAGSDPSRAVELCIQQKGAARRLAEALAGHLLSRDVATLAVRSVQSSGRNEPDLVTALSVAGRLESSPWQLEGDERRKLIDDAARSGDPNKGELVYRRAALTCQKCHAIGGAGGLVGPDLVSIGASAQPDYLLESLLDPSKKIKENYHSLVVETDEGQVVTGIKLRETPSELILRNAEDQEIRVPLEIIEDRTDGGSLMPKGLVDGLTRSELVDLLRFLSDLGKVGSGMTLPREPFVRSWEVLMDDNQNLRALRDNGLQAAAAPGQELAWSRVYSLVGGDLPLTELPRVDLKPGQQYVILRTLIKFPSDGTMTLTSHKNRRSLAWFNRRQIETDGALKLTAQQGAHVLTLLLPSSSQDDQDAETLRYGLRFEAN